MREKPNNLFIFSPLKEEDSTTKHFFLSVYNVNFISGSSQVDGDMIPHMITFGYLSESPWLQIKKKQWWVVFSECWWLIRWHVVVPLGASSLLPLPLLHTHSHKHSHPLLAYLWGARASLSMRTIVLPLFISSHSFIWEMESKQLPQLTCCSSGDTK